MHRAHAKEILFKTDSVLEPSSYPLSYNLARSISNSIPKSTALKCSQIAETAST